MGSYPSAEMQSTYSTAQADMVVLALTNPRKFIWHQNKEAKANIKLSSDEPIWDLDGWQFKNRRYGQQFIYHAEQCFVSMDLVWFPCLIAYQPSWVI